MKNTLRKYTGHAAALLAVVSAMFFSAYAGVDNPATGDTQGKYLGIVVAVLAISLIVIIVIAVTSSKKK